MKRNDNIQEQINNKHIEFYDKTLRLLEIILKNYSNELIESNISYLEMPKSSIQVLDFLISSIGKIQKGQRLALGLDDEINLEDLPEINIIEGIDKNKI